MARRRPTKRASRTSTPRRRSGAGWLWIPVILVAGFSGWLAYRAFVPLRPHDPADPMVAEASEPWVAPMGSNSWVFDPIPFPTHWETSSPLPPSTLSSPTPSLPPSVPLPTPEPSPLLTDPDLGSRPPTNPPVVTTPPPEPKTKLSTEKWVGVQLAMARRGISSGSIDGVPGAQTRAALRVFQKAEGLPVTGDADPATLQRLGVGGSPYSTYTITAEDITSLTWVPKTWMEKSRRTRLGYESVLELVAERSHAHPRLIRGLNPDVDWSRVGAGRVVRVPAATAVEPKAKAAQIRISLSEKTLRVYDARSNLLAHFPCSIAAKVEKRPVGVMRVVRIAPQPNYRFDPDIFPESPEARRIKRRLMIPPGPNNPVGVAWIGLDKPGYGIHGTPNPEEVGRTESHGCFRLANWNAEYLIKLVWIGLPVKVER